MSEGKKIINTGKFLYLLLVPILLIAGAVGYYNYDKYSNWYDNAYQLYIGEEFIKIAENSGYDYSFKLVNDSSFGWAAEDGLYINNPSTGVEIVFNDSVSKEEFTDFVDRVSSETEEVLAKSGFEKNTLNTEDSDDILGAYELDEDTKCVIVEPSCSDGNTLRFECTESFSENYDNQSIYLEDLEKENEEITSMDVSGNFVSLNMSEKNSCSGYNIIAKKVDGKWTSIYEGQEIMSCGDTETYEIPVDLMPECSTEDGSTVTR